MSHLGIVVDMIGYALVALALVACSESAAPAPERTLSPSPSPSEWRSAVPLEIRHAVEGPLVAADCAKRSGVLWDRKRDTCFVPGPTALSISRFVHVAAVQSPVGHWLVEIGLPADVGEELGAVTEASIDRPLLLVLDGELLAAPIVQARVTSEIQITGDFTQADVEQLAARLNATG